MKKAYLRSLELTCCVVLATACSTLAQTSPPDHLAAVADSDDALRIAMEVTGFNVAYSGASGRPEDRLERLAENAVIESGFGLDGKEWRILVGDVVVPWKELSPTEQIDYSRDFAIYIDSSTGALTKAVSYRARLSSDPQSNSDEFDGVSVCPEPNSLFAGFPDSVIVTLSDALARCPLSAHLATGICARYVLESSDESGEPRPRWIINLEGIPPVHFYGEGADQLPEGYGTRTEIIYDIRTGKVIAATPDRGY